MIFASVFIIQGSNENLNGMFRRKAPKGTDLSKLPLAFFKDAENWMNDYPRGIHGYHSARELFNKYIAEIKGKNL